MAHQVVVDTSVYVALWTGALELERLEAMRHGLAIRHSAVVLSELARGARTRKAMKLVEALKRVSRDPWVPNDADWWKAGLLIRDIGDQRRWETSKRREFQNDALIALTARRYGAAVVTRNRADFELLAAPLRIRIVVV